MAVLSDLSRGTLALPFPSTRIFYWGKTLSKFISVQLVVQGLGVASGILLVRTLSQQEYAYFTIAFAMQSTMNVLADSGVGIGLTAIGGRVWHDPRRFGQLVNTALRIRRWLATIAALIVAPILLWFLTGKGAGVPYAGLLTLLVLLSLSCQLSTGVLMIVPRLCKQIGRIQRLDLIASGARLVLLVAAYFIFLNAAVATFAALGSVLVQFLLLKRWVADNIDIAAPPSTEDQAAIGRIIKNEAPNSVFYCVQGQLTVWLVAFFGNAQKVAEVGALGRLSVVFTVVGAVMTSIVLPGFARCQESRRLLRLYLRIVGCFCLFGALLVALAALFPDQLLWVLGSKYAHLKNELVLMMGLSALSAVVGAMWSLNTARAWIRYSWLNIPGVLITQAVLLLLINVSTIEGVLLFGILSLLPTVALNSMLTCRGLLGKSPLVSLGQ
ncbi:MAG: polysaccharide biosynthesis protein [Pyrinomonadaceae bacterium]